MKPQRRPTREDWRAREARRERIRPTVEKHVPLPPPRSRYSFDEMGHGDSVWIPWSPTDRKRRSNGGRCRTSATSNAHTWVKRHLPGWRAVTRTEGEGTRVWFVDQSREEG